MLVQLKQPNWPETKNLHLRAFLSTPIWQLSSSLFWIVKPPRKRAELLAALNLCC